MDFTFMDSNPSSPWQIPIRAKINTLISSDLAASELLNNFLFCFQDHFPPSRIGPPSWKTLTVILVDRLARSTNFKYKSLLHVNGHTHITPYVSNIETTNTLSDLQFCRYNQTLLRVAIPNMKLLHWILPFLCQKMCTCIKLFLRPPLTQCYFCQFYRNFNKLWIICTKLDTRNWNTNWSYWIPRT